MHIEAATKASAKGATTTLLRSLELHQNQEKGEHQAGINPSRISRRIRSAGLSGRPRIMIVFIFGAQGRIGGPVYPRGGVDAQARAEIKI